ncbi:hypothetical protein LFM09_23200 [Lentzea alba]|uniref:hypothetical protein n=1 Tax=Lentzea alba TaxID=2714351 RepID=UPI0039BF5BCA
MKSLLRVLGALVLVSGIVAYVVWQRPEPPVIPPPAPKEVVLQYADGSKMWSSFDGGFRPPPLVSKVFRELDQAKVPYDSLRVSGAVVRTTIDARAQSVAATVIGRLAEPQRKLGVSVTAIDPASGAVLVYTGGSRQEVDMAGGVITTPSPGIVEPFAAVPDLVQPTMSPLDVNVAYATVAAGGVLREPRFVNSVTAADGSVLHKAIDNGKPVFGRDIADRITAGLKEKAGCNGAACVTGAYPWLAGYTPELAVTVFILEQAGAVVDDPDLPRVIWQEFLATMAG